MAEDKQAEFNIFIANSIYPDAAAIFTTQLKPLDSVKDDSIVILDTNALLVPYNTEKKSLDQIESTYRKLVNEKRLIIPGQVAREFARNRANKIGELFQQLTRKKSSIRDLQVGTYPLLEALAEYREVVHLEEKIDKLLKDYKDAVSKVLEHIRGWTWNDPVSILYSQLFDASVIFDLSIDEDLIQDDLAKRQLHNIPPGYKDSGKEDKGVGDLLIWHSILEIGKTRGKNVIFVSGDEKADWYHRSEGQALYPRYELVDEFRRSTNGKSFHIVSFSRFLDLYGASESVVQEVRQKEVQVSRVVKLPSSSRQKAILAEEAVYHWLIERYPTKAVIPAQRISLASLGSTRFDFVLEDIGHTTTAVEIRFVTRGVLGSLSRRLREMILTAQYAIEENIVDEAIIVIVTEDEDTLVDLSGRFEMDKKRFPSISFVLGYLDSSGAFEAVFEV